jgi:2-polyprenyl-6-hydroxyphenyl methylase/3-demethylubiquinone-9 3-methyltransferase
MEMLEHVPDPASTIRACATLVKPGGSVFFSTLNRNLKSYLMAVVGAEYVLNLLPGHPRVRQVHQAVRARPLRARSRPGRRRAHRDAVQPHQQGLFLGRDTDVNYLMRTTRNG